MNRSAQWFPEKFLVVVAAVLLIALTGCDPSHLETFANPIEAVGQDPFVTHWDQRYLLIEERNDNELWILESRPNDLTGIAQRGTAHQIWQAPTRGNDCTDLWAPELHHVAKRWFVYYSATTCDGNNKNHRNRVLESVSNNPLGHYIDAGLIVNSPNRWSIDGTEFTWRYRRYFVWSGWSRTSPGPQNLYIAPMNSPTSLLSAPILLSRPTYTWEQQGAPIEEGPEALQHQGKLFIVYSASGSWTNKYCDGLLQLRGTDPLAASNWIKSAEPVFKSGNDVYAPGHGSFVNSPDGTQTWMIYHSAIAEGSGWDRQVDTQPITWTEKGEPQFGRPVAETAEIPVPSGQK